jgi:hypothetical protein
VPDPKSALGLAWELFHQLRRRRFSLGIPDIEALRSALEAGFGWRSRDEFCDLTVALWAKSAREADTIRALFARLEWPVGWTADTWDKPPIAPVTGAQPAMQPVASTPVSPPAALVAVEPPPVTKRHGSLPPLVRSREDPSDARLVFVPQYPLTHREIAQAFRRLRRPLRFGPATELDIDATIRRRSRTGVMTTPVLVPRRRNLLRLLLLIDVQGSMTPYEPFIDAFHEAVVEAGLLQQVLVRFFHDVPTPTSDLALLDELGDTFFPTLDPIIGRIEADASGEVFADKQLEQAEPLEALLSRVDMSTVAIIVSDAGAARGRRDLERLLATAAFLKNLQMHVRYLAWLNPLPRAHWQNTVAGHLARHVPMHPLDRRGVHSAVNALRGQPVNLERPL